MWSLFTTIVCSGCGKMAQHDLWGRNPKCLDCLLTPFWIKDLDSLVNEE